MKKNKLLAIISKTISKYGYYVQQVLGTDIQPGFAYSVGLLETFNKPELICFATNSEVAAGLVEGTVQLIQRGETIIEGNVYGEIANYPVTFRKVHPSQIPDYLKLAWLYKKGEAFEVIQIYWPDPEGLLPWQMGFDPSLKSQQPFLFEKKMSST
jgi:Domain of unknown function (DUF4262)